MNKSDALKKELSKIGIHTEAQLREAMKKTCLNVSLMAAVPQKERKAS